jgi:hypothetical protein
MRPWGGHVIYDTTLSVSILTFFAYAWVTEAREVTAFAKGLKAQ